MIWLIIVALVWILGGFAAYFGVISKWEGNTQFEKVWFSCFWPLILMLYPIHWIHNNVG